MTSDDPFPAKYDQAADDNLVERLGKALALAKVLQAEFNAIRRHTLWVKWGATTESLLAHLEIDLQYLQQEFEQIRG